MSRALSIPIRLPLFIAASAYIVLALLAPSQIVDVIASTSTDGTALHWVTFFGGAILGGAALLAGVATRGKMLPIRDSLLAAVPLLAINIMMESTIPLALWMTVPVSVLALAGYFGIARFAWPASASARRTFFVLAAVAVAAAIATVLIDPMQTPIAVGPLGTITIGLAIVTLFIAMIASSPLIFGAYVVVCAEAAMLGGSSIPIPTLNNEQGYTGPTARSALVGWLEARGDLPDYVAANKPYPVILSSAEGGGIYAAAHSYLAMSSLQAACPNFAQHLFATVGVSGGGVGQLLFSSSLDPTAHNGRLAECTENRGHIALKPITHDMLSPVVANLLFVQLAEFLIIGPQVFPDGGNALADGIALAMPNNERATEPLRGSWRAEENRPAMHFVATDAKSGNRLVFSALHRGGSLRSESYPVYLSSKVDIAKNVAAVASARFPWITATARLRLPDGGERILADGGYFENTGADTILDLSAQITSAVAATNCQGCRCPRYHLTASTTERVTWTDCDRYVSLVYLPIKAGSLSLLGRPPRDSFSPKQSYWLDPLGTMLQTRESRGLLAMDRARMYFAGVIDPTRLTGNNAAERFFSQELPVQMLSLPLGWKLSTQDAVNVLKAVSPLQKCNEPDNEDLEGIKNEADAGGNQDLPISGLLTVARANGCRMQMLASIFDLNGPVGPFAIEKW